MKYLSLLLAAASLAVPALAQSQCAAVAAAIPSCAQSCIESADSAVGCAVTDYACGCSKSAQVQQSAAGCVLGACPISVIASVQAQAASLCSCAATAKAAPTSTLVTTTKSTPPATTSTPPSSTPSKTTSPSPKDTCHDE